MFDLRLPGLMFSLMAICCASCVDDRDHSQSVSDQSVSQNPDSGIDDDSALPNSNGSVELQVVDDLPTSTRSDAFYIDSAKVVEDILQLEVSYSGGCEDHTFAAFWAPVFREESPESMEILITHDARNGSCEAWIPQKLAIDLMPLRKTIQPGCPQDNTSENVPSEITVTLIVDGPGVAQFPYKF